MNMTYDDQNIFAKILRGEIPNQTVLETEHCLAFRDINPSASTHVLVIPKGAYVSAADFTSKASDAEIVDLVRTLGKIGEMEGVVESGYRILSNHGKDAYQEVPHFHVHVLGGGPLRKGLNS
ncbi:MAG: HIT domain-containing protein [Alphaproteobacteria bacterium]